MSSLVKLNTKKIPVYQFKNITTSTSFQGAVEALLSVGMIFLGFTSLGGAFVSGCPFRSAFSDVIRLIFETIRHY